MLLRLFLFSFLLTTTLFAGERGSRWDKEVRKTIELFKTSTPDADVLKKLNLMLEMDPDVIYAIERNLFPLWEGYKLYREDYHVRRFKGVLGVIHNRINLSAEYRDHVMSLVGTSEKDLGVHLYMLRDFFKKQNSPEQKLVQEKISKILKERSSAQSLSNTLRFIKDNPGIQSLDDVLELLSYDNDKIKKEVLQTIVKYKPGPFHEYSSFESVLNRHLGPKGTHTDDPRLLKIFTYESKSFQETAMAILADTDYFVGKPELIAELSLNHNITVGYGETYLEHVIDHVKTRNFSYFLKFAKRNLDSKSETDFRMSIVFLAKEARSSKQILEDEGIRKKIFDGAKRFPNSDDTFPYMARIVINLPNNLPKEEVIRNVLPLSNDAYPFTSSWILEFISESTLSVDDKKEIVEEIKKKYPKMMRHEEFKTLINKLYPKIPKPKPVKLLPAEVSQLNEIKAGLKKKELFDQNMALRTLKELAELEVEDSTVASPYRVDGRVADEKKIILRKGMWQDNELVDLLIRFEKQEQTNESQIAAKLLAAIEPAPEKYAVHLANKRIAMKCKGLGFVDRTLLKYFGVGKNKE